MDGQISKCCRGAGATSVKTAYVDGELCGVDDAGLPSFARTRAASDGERCVHVVYYAFDLLHLAGRDVSSLPLIEMCKALLEPLVAGKAGLQFNGHDAGDGELIPDARTQARFRGRGLKGDRRALCAGKPRAMAQSQGGESEEFVIVGWYDPEGSRPYLGALLLGYYTDGGKLIYAGRVGTGMADKVLADLRRRLDPLARKSSPLNDPPPRSMRFGSPLVLARVHWVEPKLVAEITFLTWTADNLLRHTVYVGLREDKPADQVRRETARG